MENTDFIISHTADSVLKANYNYDSKMPYSFRVKATEDLDTVD